MKAEGNNSVSLEDCPFLYQGRGQYLGISFHLLRIWYHLSSVESYSTPSLPAESVFIIHLWAVLSCFWVGVWLWNSPHWSLLSLIKDCNWCPSDPPARSCPSPFPTNSKNLQLRLWDDGGGIFFFFFFSLWEIRPDPVIRSSATSIFFRLQVQLFDFYSKNIWERIGAIKLLVFIFYCQGTQRKTYNYQLLNLGLRRFQQISHRVVKPGSRGADTNFWEQEESLLSCFIQLYRLTLTTQ